MAQVSEDVTLAAAALFGTSVDRPFDRSLGEQAPSTEGCPSCGSSTLARPTRDSHRLGTRPLLRHRDSEASALPRLVLQRLATP